MKRRPILLCSHIWRWLIALLLLLGLAVMPAFAEQTPSATVDPLKPTDLTYENGNIILHKQGERIGPDEWKVTVKATVGEQPVEKRKLEVVFLLDRSGSMDATAHTHNSTCPTMTCKLTEHVHTLENHCYSITCDMPEKEHTDGCYVVACGKDEHISHSIADNCYLECTMEKNPSHYYWGFHTYYNVGCELINEKYYYLNCNKVHTHSDECKKLNCTDESHHEHTVACRTVTCTQKEHTHSYECYSCPYYATSSTVNSLSRFDVAVRAAERLIANLPKETDVAKRRENSGLPQCVDSRPRLRKV